MSSELVSTLILPALVQQPLWTRYVLGGYDDFWVVGAMFVIRADVFHDVGGFDEQFFLYSEETDLDFRIRERGWAAAIKSTAPIQAQPPIQSVSAPSELAGRSSLSATRSISNDRRRRL